ncbi:hypothetical protein D3C73_1120890 [compost metagenome]
MYSSLSGNCRISAKQTACGFPGDLRNLQRMRQPCTIVISGSRSEYLRLPLQSAKGRRVNEPGVITLVGCAIRFVSGIILKLPVLSQFLNIHSLHSFTLCYCSPQTDELKAMNQTFFCIIVCLAKKLKAKYFQFFIDGL